MGYEHSHWVMSCCTDWFAATKCSDPHEWEPLLISLLLSTTKPQTLLCYYLLYLNNQKAIWSSETLYWYVNVMIVLMVMFVLVVEGPVVRERRSHLVVDNQINMTQSTSNPINLVLNPYPCVPCFSCMSILQCRDIKDHNKDQKTSKK